MKIYLAGPMRGVPHFNYPAFHAETARLRGLGHEVFSPAEADVRAHGRDISNAEGCLATAEKEHGFSIRAALKEDLSWICDHADAVVMLPGWTRSHGAVTEHALAVALGLEVYLAGAL